MQNTFPAPPRSIAIWVALGMFAAAVFLVVDRGGILAWVGVVAGALLFLKVLRWPSPRDAVTSVSVLGIWVMLWAGTWWYVRAAWESGEVLQMRIADKQTVRVWVLDMSDGPVVYYDAPPEAADLLLGGAPLSWTRAGHTKQGCAAVERASDLSEEQALAVVELMEEKYKGANMATNVFYLALGGKRDREGLLIRQQTCD